jgi:F1F0 ATPase subunit 2
MIEPLHGALAALAGGGLGALYFGGLWWTVRRGLGAKRPALWFVASLLLRTGLALAGFYYVSGGRGLRLALCLLGFIIARIALIRWTKPAWDGGARGRWEASHAP